MINDVNQKRDCENPMLILIRDDYNVPPPLSPKKIVQYIKRKLKKCFLSRKIRTFFLIDLRNSLSFSKLQQKV